MSATYFLAISIHIFGSAANLVWRGAEPSVAGQSVPAKASVSSGNPAGAAAATLVSDAVAAVVSEAMAAVSAVVSVAAVAAVVSDVAPPAEVSVGAAVVSAEEAMVVSDADFVQPIKDMLAKPTTANVGKSRKRIPKRYPNAATPVAIVPFVSSQRPG